MSKTQKEMVLEHLQNFGFIEPLTALREYGCYRLSAIIYLLRDDGLDIRTEMLEGRSRITGKIVRFAKYILQNE